MSLGKKSLSIGLIGDYDPSIPAHRAIPIALQLAAEKLALGVGHEWIPTDEISNQDRISQFDGLRCVPGRPYRNSEGALCAIRFARETNCPFLGTCRGFQHAVPECARNIRGLASAEHAETAPHAKHLVITPLECNLVEVTDSAFLKPGTKIHKAICMPGNRRGVSMPVWSQLELCEPTRLSRVHHFSLRSLWCYTSNQQSPKATQCP
jgi:CTP synthase (UTP-ammonia lyase)